MRSLWEKRGVVETHTLLYEIVKTCLSDQRWNVLVAGWAAAHCDVLTCGEFVESEI